MQISFLEEHSSNYTSNILYSKIKEFGKHILDQKMLKKILLFKQKKKLFNVLLKDLILMNIWLNLEALLMPKKIWAVCTTYGILY